MSNPDVLAALADVELQSVWSAETNVILERKLWITVLEAQMVYVSGTSPKVVDAYKANIGFVDLESIRQREFVTKHDVKARIEEFNALAGHEAIHRGLTSHDVVDCITQVKIKRSLMSLASRYDECKPLGAVAGQYPFRGLKGPVGTMQDLADLCGSDDAARDVEAKLANALGFARVFNNTQGQIYPRSIDIEVATEVAQCVWARGGVLWCLIQGYLSMLADCVDSSWLEGDVAGSVVRRVALPGLFFATDAILSDRCGISGSKRPKPRESFPGGQTKS